jgi:hypothetical protein
VTLEQELLQEAVHRFWTDPVFHARVIRTVQVLGVRSHDDDADAVYKAASVALVLAERDPVTVQSVGGTT